MKPNTIWVVDTSILLNLLEHPDRSQSRDEVITLFQLYLEAGHSFVIPITTIIETGNWAYKLPAGLRQPFAAKFVDWIDKSLSGETPFRILEFPDRTSVREYLKDFPTQADTMGFGDLMILKQWEEQCLRIPGYQINIWSLDNEALKGRECNH